MTTTGKVNGDFTEDNEVKSPPRSQRKPRLNRRGFHLSNHPLMKVFADKSDMKKSVINGCDDSMENKIKTDSSQTRIISLSSEKSSSVKSKQSSSIIHLKKTSFSPKENKNRNSDVTGVSSSCDPPAPPPKKHKPITWP